MGPEPTFRTLMLIIRHASKGELSANSETGKAGERPAHGPGAGITDIKPHPSSPLCLTDINNINPLPSRSWA